MHGGGGPHTEVGEGKGSDDVDGDHKCKLSKRWKDRHTRAREEKSASSVTQEESQGSNRDDTSTL